MKKITITFIIIGVIFAFFKVAAYYDTLAPYFPSISYGKELRDAVEVVERGEYDEIIKISYGDHEYTYDESGLFSAAWQGDLFFDIDDYEIISWSNRDENGYMQFFYSDIITADIFILDSYYTLYLRDDFNYENETLTVPDTDIEITLAEIKAGAPKPDTVRIDYYQTQYVSLNISASENLLVTVGIATVNGREFYAEVGEYEYYTLPADFITALVEAEIIDLDIYSPPNNII